MQCSPVEVCKVNDRRVVMVKFYAEIPGSKDSQEVAEEAW